MDSAVIPAFTVIPSPSFFRPDLVVIRITPVTGPRTVKCSCRSSFQDRHRSDIFRVNIRKAVTHIGSRITPNIIHTACKIIHRRTVHHDQWLIATGQRLLPRSTIFEEPPTPLLERTICKPETLPDNELAKFGSAGRQQLVSLQFLHGVT